MIGQVTTSAPGTFETSRRTRRMSACWGRPEVADRRSERREWTPFRKSAWLPRRGQAPAGTDRVGCYGSGLAASEDSLLNDRVNSRADFRHPHHRHQISMRAAAVRPNLTRIPSLEAFGRRPRCKPYRLDRPLSDTLHNKPISAWGGHRQRAFGTTA